jgi:hypothetical protein
VYPVKVTVSAEVNGTKKYIWSGKQQHLFGKYATQRAQSMAAIEAKLQELKDEFDIE